MGLNNDNLLNKNKFTVESYIVLKWKFLLLWCVDIISLIESCIHLETFVYLRYF